MNIHRPAKSKRGFGDPKSPSPRPFRRRRVAENPFIVVPEELAPER